MAGYGIATKPTSVVRPTSWSTGFTSANTNLLQLGEAFTYAGPLAKAAGFAFEETAAALALMGNAGYQGSLAGTSLRGAIVRLLTPTTETTKIMQRLGVNVLRTPVATFCRSSTYSPSSRRRGYQRVRP